MYIAALAVFPKKDNKNYVDPEKEQVSVYRFEESDQAREYTFKDTIEVGIFEDLSLNLKEMKEYLEG